MNSFLSSYPIPNIVIGYRLRENMAFKKVLTQLHLILLEFLFYRTRLSLGHVDFSFSQVKLGLGLM